LDRAESVFYVGTFSKSLFPEIRLGFIVVPLWARAALIAAKQHADWHCAALAQDTLAAFIAEGHMARHVRKMRGVYAERRAVMLAALNEDFQHVLTPVDSAAGLHLAALSKPGIDADTLVARALKDSVRFYSLSTFSPAERGKSGFVFGYGALDVESIEAGLARLRRNLGSLKLPQSGPLKGPRRSAQSRA
jgi:GntR family transcriptional regulator/MocR family aminotransferase